MTTADRGPSRAEFADAKGRSERARGRLLRVGIVGGDFGVVYYPGGSLTG